MRSWERAELTEGLSKVTSNVGGSGRAQPPLRSLHDARVRTEPARGGQGARPAKLGRFRRGCERCCQMLDSVAHKLEARAAHIVYSPSSPSHVAEGARRVSPPLARSARSRQRWLSRASTSKGTSQSWARAESSGSRALECDGYGAFAAGIVRLPALENRDEHSEQSVGDASDRSSVLMTFGS